ncbi:MAG: MFS transporter [Deltaproteobacteria bacterium]|nr:MFS transporter [Deltaproteobacteria bacterium]
MNPPASGNPEPITANSESPSSPASPWSPLREPVFRALWLAAITSNIGTLMQTVGAAWLMTLLAASPLLVALVQTANTLPVFLLALPAGALADMLDRRRLILFTQSWMMFAAAGMGVLTLLGQMTPGVLLAFTFLLGLGTALNAPAWQAIVPDLVHRAQIPAAVALNSIGFNLARAVGPALGGLVVAAAGSGVVFLLNAFSFLGVIAVLFFWKWPSRLSPSPAERIIEAIGAGVRYVRHSPALPPLYARAAAFALFGTALQALLPLFAREALEVGPTGYGLLLGAFGGGAILGAAFMPAALRKVGVNALLGRGFVLFAAAEILMAWLRSFFGVFGVMVLAGAAWLTVLSILNTKVQTATPSWVRGRALAFYILTFSGGMALGGALWGLIAEFLGIPAAFHLSAGGLILSAWVARRFRLIPGDLDLTPSLHWPEHMMAVEPQPEHGPVLVTVEYRIDPERAEEFARTMETLGRVRRGSGAMRWGLFHDTADPGRYVETFLVESWAEHLRQHERITMADRAAEERARSFHLGPDPPVVSHLIHAYNGSK